MYTFSWCIVSELWLFVLRHVATPQNRLYPAPVPPTSLSITMCSVSTLRRLNKIFGLLFKLFDVSSGLLYLILHDVITRSILKNSRCTRYQ